MSDSQQVPLTDDLLEYVLSVSERLPPAVATAIRRADEMGRSSMQVSPDQALLIRFLLRTAGARQVLEIGTFLGLSAVVMADAVGPDGRVVCLDKSAEWTDHARELWRDAGVADRIDLVLGDAHETIGNVADSFDAVFIDADKSGYLDYLEKVTPRLRSGGLLMVDNTLWSGRVVDPSDEEADTEAIRRFNTTLAHDDRYEVAVVAVADGLTLARKR